MTAAPAAPAGWRGLWTVSRARLWLLACALAAYLPALGMPARGWLDFSAFYAAGRLAFSPQVVQLLPIAQFQADHGLPPTPFVYPAWTALPYVPLAALPYDVAGALHVALMLAALLAAAVLGGRVFGIPRGWAVLGTLAWAPAAAGVVSGQNTSLALLLVVALIAALQRGRPVLAGAMAGLLLYKPQLDAPVVLTLAWRVAARALVAAAAVVGAQYLLGVVAAGGDWGWPATWWATVQAYNPLDLAANGWQAVSLPALLGRLTPGGAAPGSFTGPALVGYLAGALIVLRSLPALRTWPPDRAVALACAAGLLVSPHAWVYDAALLLPALAVFAVDARRRGWPWQDRWLLAAAYAIAVTWPLGGPLGKVGVLLVVVVVMAPFALQGWWPFRWTRPQATGWASVGSGAAAGPAVPTSPSSRSK
ncbi:MAG TPA: glycosyltransferase 87 family protein [Candidatus Sulfotelmatobacter sp.]|nr:glycosyltransferase 87 family protein [Candidatus Sulfotelmatobacter sp.]